MNAGDMRLPAVAITGVDRKVRADRLHGVVRRLGFLLSRQPSEDRKDIGAEVKAVGVLY
jgi:hypothetical protein